MKVKLAYQVYSAREEAEKDLLGVLRRLADIGYDGVELAGAYGHSADEVKEMLKATGLKAISSHVPLMAFDADEDGVIAFHKQIGCEYIAIPFLDDATRPGGPNFAKTIRRLYDLGAKLKKAGMQLLYHNHNFEFDMISGIYGLDFIYDAVSEDLLKTEIDTCWVNVAGEDPAKYVRKYAGRCPVVHLKDFVGSIRAGEKPFALIRPDGSDDEPVDAKAMAFDFRPVGYGVQDIPSIVKAGVEGGAQWFVVEQDLSSERPALEAAKMSCDYVRGL